MSQYGLRYYFPDRTIWREPDEAFYIKYKDPTKRPIIKIIEKKFQKSEGSVADKIMAGPIYKEEYIEFFPDFDVMYAFNLSDFFKKKWDIKDNISTKPKYKSWINRLNRHNIPIFWGDECSDEIKKWVIN